MNKKLEFITNKLIKRQCGHLSCELLFISYTENCEFKKFVFFCVYLHKHSDLQVLASVLCVEVFKFKLNQTDRKRLH